MEQLKDIKPLVEIPDNSLIYLVFIGILMLILCSIAVVMFIKKRRSVPLSAKHIAQQKLFSLNFDDSKHVAYSFSAYGKYLITEQNRQQFVVLEQELHNYKYKKQVNSLDAKLITKIKEFISV